MINLVKREDYSSEEEYQEAVKEMLKDIEFHNRCHPESEYDPNYKEKFLKSLESIDEYPRNTSR